jgi:hypothetical protein
MYAREIETRLVTNSSVGILNMGMKMESIGVALLLERKAGTDGSSAQILGFSYLLKAGFYGLFLGLCWRCLQGFWSQDIVGKEILNMRESGDGFGFGLIGIGLDGNGRRIKKRGI